MYLAIDLGSTSFKAAIFTSDLQRVGSGEEFVTHEYPGTGQVELPVNKALAGFTGCIKKAIENAGVSPNDIKAIAITSQAQTFTIMDASGNCRIPFRSWQDERSLPTCQRVEQNSPWNKIGGIAGVNKLLPSLQVAMLLHLKECEGITFAPTDRLMPLPSYLIYLLTGCHATDGNIAAMSGLYDVNKAIWWDEAVSACGMMPKNMAKLFEIGDVAGYSVDSELGIPAGIPVILAGNDQTAGAFGADMPNGGVLAILGTALVAYKVQDTLPVYADDGVILRGPYPGGKYYLLTTENNCGNVINWAVTALGYDDDYQNFFTAAFSAVSGCNGLVFDPDLSSGTGGWRNLSLRHTRADMAQSVLESLTMRTTGLINQLHADKSLPVYIAGGGTRASGWIDMLAENISVPVVPVQADPLLGAAKMILITNFLKTEN